MAASAERDLKYSPQFYEPVLEFDENPAEYEDFRWHATTFWQGIRFATTWHSSWMVLLTCLATFACSKGILDFSFDTSMDIITIGTVLPLVFSVQASFTRREKVLASLAKIKAACFTIYLMFYTWEKQKTGRWAADVEKLIRKLLDDIEWSLRCDQSRKGEEPDNMIYDAFSSFAAMMDKVGTQAGFKEGGGGGQGRMTAYLRTIMQEFEHIRAVRDSETPVGLRLFCFALIHTTPIVLAPYWNNFCEHESGSEIEGLKTKYGCFAGYFVATAYVLIVITLYRVQTELEDPFDGDGDDDIKWEVWRSQLDQLGNYGNDGQQKRNDLARYMTASKARHEMRTSST